VRAITIPNENSDEVFWFVMAPRVMRVDRLLSSREMRSRASHHASETV